MLLFAGAAAYDGLMLIVNYGIQMILAASRSALSGEQILILIRLLGVSLLMLAAGLLPALYEWIMYRRMVKAQPKCMVKSGLLTIAAVLACVNLALSLLRMAAIISVTHNEMLVYNLPQLILGLLFDICLLLSCFMMKRRMGVMYRLFFAGHIALGAVTQPIFLITQLLVGNDFSALVANLVLSIVGISAAVFAIVHAAKYRFEDFVPLLPPPSNDESAPSAATI